METESKTRTARLDECGPDHAALWAPGADGWQGSPLVLSTDDLQDIVQAAYDQYGILAEPSIVVEQERHERDAAGTDAAAMLAHDLAGWNRSRSW